MTDFIPCAGHRIPSPFHLPVYRASKFAKGIIDSRWYFPFKWATAFSAHGSAGWAEGYGGDEVPVFQRFFLGGLDSLRGFKDRKVGPIGKKVVCAECTVDGFPVYLERRRNLRRRQDGVLPV